MDTPVAITRKLSILLTTFVTLCTFPFQGFASETEEWRFTIAPYAWLAGQSGTVGTSPGYPAADIDIDFYDDILGNINGAIMLVGDAMKGDFGISADVVYTDIEIGDQTPGEYFNTLSSRTTSWLISASGVYRLYGQDKGQVDLLAGLRYWSVESELSVTAGLLPSNQIANKEDWVDPLIGIRGRMPIGQSKFFISGLASIGGFGVGSDLLWDLSVNLAYQFSEVFLASLGYRYLDVDYEDNGYLYDISQDGPTMALIWQF
ncbi:hypothetical protein [Desulfopila sp. IMCC35008]|uniref:hypothetical protein n=1 Tax=Desulfopila sp. IMCC35008 TaxID=2653858 RepID=UPI0013D64FA9|nr:hypothetical protein [Desulfopila sp. IMCC35008]